MNSEAHFLSPACSLDSFFEKIVDALESLLRDLSLAGHRDKGIGERQGNQG